jgi:hypothetical protein
VKPSSDNEAEIGYLNGMDKTIPHLDVLDDYKSEKKEISRKNPEIGEQANKFIKLNVFSINISHCFFFAVHDR